MRTGRYLITTALVLYLCSGLTFAHEVAPERKDTANSIGGSVRDALGRPLAAVEVSLQTAQGKIVARTTTDKSGHFIFAVVPAGKYRIVARKSGFRTGVAVLSTNRTATKPLAIALEASAALSLTVAAKRLEPARNSISSATGGSVYHFSAKAVQQLPQGSNSQMNGLLLQAPSVAQDSFGQLHIRGEHGEVQYRINGIELPEGITSGFSQTFSPRLAQNISLIEGALPAKYGYHTAGVVEVQTKSGSDLEGGDIEMYGGQRYTLNPSFELGGSEGKLSYYTTGFYLQNDRGLEPPTPGPQAHHDFTTVGNGFGYLSYVLNSTTRLSAIGGFNVSNFQIPANPGQMPTYQLAGVSSYPSINLRETQLEQNYVGTIALQGNPVRDVDYQIAGFSRYSTLSFHPDQVGDLMYNGVASRIFRSDWASGLQGDSSYRGIETHTFSAGFYFSGERAEIDNHALVFPGSSTGQTGDEPRAVVDDGALTAWNYGAYLQDEWHPNKKLTLNYGVRFDLYDGLTRSNQFSPRAGAVYQLFDKTALHAAYARYFTPPPLESVSNSDIQKFKGTTNEPVVKAASTVVPERAHYFDVGVTQTLPFGLNVDLDSYYKKSSDLIDEGQFGPTLVFTPFNYQKGRQYGVELTTSLNRDSFTAYTNFAYGVAQGINQVSEQFLFDPAELAYAQKHYVSLDHDQTFTESAGIAYSLQGYTFTLSDIYGSGLRSGFANTGNQPFYIQFDAGIVKTLKLSSVGELTGRVAVINLGDWIYPIRSGSGIGVFAPQYGPRRSFYGGLKWEIPFFNRNGSIH